MKPRHTYLVHKWNEHTGKWDPFRRVEAYSAKQACYFITTRFPFRLSDLSARLLPPAPPAPPAVGSPPEAPPSQPAA